MGKTLDLGRRIELLSMDPACGNASLGLYRRDSDGPLRYLVHSYSWQEGVENRIAFVHEGLVVMAGMSPMPDHPGWIGFDCGQGHEKALRRAFLEVCRLDPDSKPKPLPLIRPDKKAECELTVVNGGEGRYTIQAPEGAANGPKRVQAVARGYVKLCETQQSEEDEATVWFSCGCSHDALMGLLFFRAQNVRSSMKDDELAAGRGTLAAPGSQ